MSFNLWSDKPGKPNLVFHMTSRTGILANLAARTARRAGITQLRTEWRSDVTQSI
jgi:hypothetical protein